jgi:hypothetical protein
MFFALGMIVTIALMGLEREIGVLLVLVSSVVQAAILCTREVRMFVNGGGRAVQVEGFPYRPSS